MRVLNRGGGFTFFVCKYALRPDGQCRVRRRFEEGEFCGQYEEGDATDDELAEWRRLEVGLRAAAKRLKDLAIDRALCRTMSDARSARESVVTWLSKNRSMSRDDALRMPVSEAIEILESLPAPDFSNAPWHTLQVMAGTAASSWDGDSRYRAAIEQERADARLAVEDRGWCQKGERNVRAIAGIVIDRISQRTRLLVTEIRTWPVRKSLDWLDENWPVEPVTEVTPGEQTGGTDSTARQLPLDDLTKAETNAYLSFSYAELKAEKGLKDREAYDQLTEDGLPDDGGDLGSLADYDLPAFDTWTRQLRGARKKLGKQKNIPRAGKAMGKSIVRVDQI
jgi:hypothetical protein